MTTEGCMYQEQDHKELDSFANSYTAYQLISPVCALIFITLVLVDVWNAFRRKAAWIPGQALVLSSLTIQSLLVIDHLDVSVHSSNKELKDVQMILLVKEQLLMDSRRVMVCVFIAYLLPGIGSGGLKRVWGDVGALASTVISHMAFEAYFFLTFDEWQIDVGTHYYYVIWQKLEPYSVWLIPSYIALSLAIILSVLLLSSAVIAGKSIRNIMSQKVPLALSCCSTSAKKRLCKNIEDHVLKSWIVVRASQPDYVMARSVFSAFAGVLVTVCVVLLLVKRICIPLPPYPMDIYAIHFVFVVIGSVASIFRWLTAVFYFPKDLRWLMNFEDFWTRELVQQKQDLRRCRLFLSLLLTMSFWVQKSVVFLSKVCWFLSQFVFGMIRPFIMKENKSDQFSKYKKALEIIRMPGENADSLWRANESAFASTENNVKKGIESGESNCKELISLIEHKTGTPEKEAPTSLQEEKQFKAVSKNSWKMRAVSLIHLIIYFCDGSNSDVVNVCIEAYRQASCFMDMVDRSDPEAKLVREAADNKFNTLENVWKKYRKMRFPKNSKRNQVDEEKGSHNDWNRARSNKLLEQKIRNPLDDNMNQLFEEEGHTNPCLDTLHDTKDWKTVAAKISLYKIWKVTVKIWKVSVRDDAIRNLRCLLANIIFHCIEEKVLDKALLKNCNKWAKAGEENDIFNAAFITGKAKGVQQQIRLRQRQRQRQYNAAVRVVAEGIEG